MQKNDDDLFCEVALDLNFISQAQIDAALEQKMVDVAIGVQKPLSAYLFDAGYLSKEQVGKILKIKDKYSSIPSNIEEKPVPNNEDVTPILKTFVEKESCQTDWIKLLADIPAESTKNLENVMRFTLEKDEEPILFVNPASKFSTWASWFYMTNKRIVFSTYKNDSSAGLLRPDIISWIPLNQISLISLGEQVLSSSVVLGYVGHELFISAIPFGLLGVGAPDPCQESLDYLNKFFLFAKEKGAFPGNSSNTSVVEQIKLNNVSLPAGWLSKVYLTFSSFMNCIMYILLFLGIISLLSWILGC